MSDRPRIFVVKPIVEEVLERLREVAEVEVFPYMHREISVAELESAARRSDYVFCMLGTPVTASMIEANPDIRGYGVGRILPDTQDLAACEAAGVKLLEGTQTPVIVDGNRRATADIMVLHVLSLAYRFVEADRYAREKGFWQGMSMRLISGGLENRTVSLIGLGIIGRFAVARLRAFGLEILYTKRSRLDPEDEKALGVEWVESLDELIARGDFVCMLANYEPANEKMMGAREFALMKPSAYFVNIARGRLVDQDAMVAALADGTIAGAGLDVFWHEPPVVAEAYIPEVLRKMDNVVLTPHMGGATYDSRGRQAMAIAEAIIADIRERDAAAAAG